MPPSGSSTSPLPVRISMISLSATIISASKLRRYLSVRQSLASSTAARISWPLYCSSFLSSRSNRVKASAVAPAKPPITSPLSPMRRTFFALGFITVLPIDTWPSPAMTVLPPFLTPRIVVPCQFSKVLSFGIEVGGGLAACKRALVDQRFEPLVGDQPHQSHADVDRDRDVGPQEGGRDCQHVGEDGDLSLAPTPCGLVDRRIGFIGAEQGEQQQRERQGTEQHDHAECEDRVASHSRFADPADDERD